MVSHCFFCECMWVDKKIAGARDTTQTTGHRGGMGGKTFNPTESLEDSHHIVGGSRGCLLWHEHFCTSTGAWDMWDI